MLLELCSPIPTVTLRQLSSDHQAWNHSAGPSKLPIRYPNGRHSIRCRITMQPPGLEMLVPLSSPFLHLQTSRQTQLILRKRMNKMQNLSLQQRPQQQHIRKSSEDCTVTAMSGANFCFSTSGTTLVAGVGPTSTRSARARGTTCETISDFTESMCDDLHGWEQQRHCL